MKFTKEKLNKKVFHFIFVQEVSENSFSDFIQLHNICKKSSIWIFKNTTSVKYSTLKY